MQDILDMPSTKQAGFHWLNFQTKEFRKLPATVNNPLPLFFVLMKIKIKLKSSSHNPKKQRSSSIANGNSLRKSN